MNGKAMKMVIASLMVSLSGATLAADVDPQHFAPMAFLVGHCWVGQFPDGKMTDEHCFEWVYGGKFLRDKHMVRGGPEEYLGETLYAWDAGKKQVAYTYWESDGGVSTGTVSPEKDRLVFPDAIYDDNGKKIVLRSSWERQGDRKYKALTEQKNGDNWRELRNIVYVRK